MLHASMTLAHFLHCIFNCSRKVFTAVSLFLPSKLYWIMPLFLTILWDRGVCLNMAVKINNHYCERKRIKAIQAWTNHAFVGLAFPKIYLLISINFRQCMLGHWALRFRQPLRPPLDGSSTVQVLEAWTMVDDAFVQLTEILHSTSILELGVATLVLVRI